MSLKKKKILSVLSNNRYAIHNDQIFDDKIDSKCCGKNLFRFFYQ